MSKVSITGDNSGTGTFTVAAPNSNNNRTFNLPDEDGVVITDSSDIEPQVKTSLNATGDAPMFACRAFVNFDGTGTVSIRDSGNVSSITDNGTGDYTVNFSNAMPDVNYAISALASNTSDGWDDRISGSTRGVFGIHQHGTTAPTTTALRLETRFGSTGSADGAAFDTSQVTFAVFR